MFHSASGLTEVELFCEPAPDALVESEVGLQAITAIRVAEQTLSMSGLVRVRYEFPEMAAEPLRLGIQLPQLAARKLLSFYNRAYTQDSVPPSKFDCISFSNYAADLIPDPFYTGPYSPRAYGEIRAASPTRMNTGSAYLMVDGTTELHSFLAINPTQGVAPLGVNEPWVLGTVEQMREVYPADKLYQQVKPSSSPSYPVAEIV